MAEPAYCIWGGWKNCREAFMGGAKGGSRELGGMKPYPPLPSPLNGGMNWGMNWGIMPKPCCG